MRNIEFYRPIRAEPDFKEAPSLEAAQKALEEYKLQLDRDTLWKCGTGFGLSNRVEPCGEFFKCSETTLIQTYWYTQPHGCTGGDYWNLGEKRLLCPNCGKEARWDDNKRYLGNDTRMTATSPFPLRVVAFAKKEDRYDD